MAETLHYISPGYRERLDRLAALLMRPPVSETFTGVELALVEEYKDQYDFPQLSFPDTVA